jgi:hypothetical protein
VNVSAARSVGLASSLDCRRHAGGGQLWIISRPDPPGTIGKRNGRASSKPTSAAFTSNSGATEIRRKLIRLGREPGFPRGRQARGGGHEQPLGAHPPAGGAAEARACAPVLSGRLVAPSPIDVKAGNGVADERPSASVAPAESVDVAFGEPEQPISAIALSTIASVSTGSRGRAHEAHTVVCS